MHLLIVASVQAYTPVTAFKYELAIFIYANMLCDRQRQLNSNSFEKLICPYTRE